MPPLVQIVQTPRRAFKATLTLRGNQSSSCTVTQLPAKVNIDIDTAFPSA